MHTYTNQSFMAKKNVSKEHKGVYTAYKLHRKFAIITILIYRLLNTNKYELFMGTLFLSYIYFSAILAVFNTFVNFQMFFFVFPIRVLGQLKNQQRRI